MRIAEVTGKITLSQWHPALAGARWVMAVPLNETGLQHSTQGRGDEFVVYDDLGCSEGARIAVSEGGEASNAFHPEVKPIDAYAAAILDEIDITSPNG